VKKLKINLKLKSAGQQHGRKDSFLAVLDSKTTFCFSIH